MPRHVIAVAALAERVLELRRAFGRPPSASPSDSDLRDGDLYLVAVHAAFEYFFEEVGRYAAHAGLAAFAATGHVSQPLGSLIECHHWQTFKNGGGEKPSQAGPVSPDTVAKAVRWYVSQIDANNGIKRSNLFSLFLPLGFVEGDFDPVWLSEMDSLGSDRGDIAHGRPATSHPRRAVVLSQSAQPTVTIWTPRALHRSQRETPWGVETKLARVWGELVRWDRKVLERTLT